MESLKEILEKVLEKEEINVIFPNLKMSVVEIVETECYQALQKIKAVIEDDILEDFECIEKIVCIFEEMDSNGGNRHDFG